MINAIMNVNVDLLWQYLLSGNFLGFIVACYTSQIGQLFYGLVVTVFTIPLYIRVRNLLFMGIVWIVVGGSIVAVVPLVSPIAILMLTFGVAQVLYSLFQRG